MEAGPSSWVLWHEPWCSCRRFDEVPMLNESPQGLNTYLGTCNFRNKKALQESSHLLQERHHGTISLHCLPKQWDRIEQDGTRQPTLLSSSTAGTQPPPCFRSDLHSRNKTYQASLWGSSECPSNVVGTTSHSNKNAHVWVPGWGLRQAPTGSSCYLDGCQWCLGLFLFWHL